MRTRMAKREEEAVDGNLETMSKIIKYSLTSLFNLTKNKLKTSSEVLARKDSYIK